MSLTFTTQNDLLMSRLKAYFSNDNYLNMKRILPYINGDSIISLRLIDWFVTNYSKKNYTVYNIVKTDGDTIRFKVFTDYKLKLKAYGKKKFDPFCRWERIVIPYENDTLIETTIGQLNFFKWALDNNILRYIEDNKREIEEDMNNRNQSLNTTKKNTQQYQTTNKTRKKRQELSLSATKSIKKEEVEIIVKFNI